MRKMLLLMVFKIFFVEKNESNGKKNPWFSFSSLLSCSEILLLHALSFAEGERRQMIWQFTGKSSFQWFATAGKARFSNKHVKLWEVDCYCPLSFRESRN